MLQFVHSVRNMKRLDWCRVSGFDRNFLFPDVDIELLCYFIVYVFVFASIITCQAFSLYECGFWDTVYRHDFSLLLFNQLVHVSFWHAKDNRWLFSDSDAEAVSTFKVRHHLLISCSYLELCSSKIGTRWPQLDLSGDPLFKHNVRILGRLRMSCFDVSIPSLTRVFAQNMCCPM